MRSRTFRRPPRAASTGIVAIAGGVLAYRPLRLDHTYPAPYAARRLTFDGRWSDANVHDDDAARRSLAWIGGDFVRGHANWIRPNPNALDAGIVGRWGMRYPNVSDVGRTPDGRIVFLWHHTGDRWSRFCPWQATPIGVSAGLRGGVVWHNTHIPSLSPTVFYLELAIPDLGAASMLGRFPGSLTAVTPDGTGLHYLRHTGSWRHWELALPPDDRLQGRGRLAPPPDLRHPSPSDLQVSADGRRLFVAWSGKGVDNVRKGCAVGVYDAATGATVHIYTFPAVLLAPDRDGLTLSFLGDFADEEETTLYQIDLD